MHQSIELEVIREVAAMRERTRDWRAASRRVAFVPTMGAFHEGHLSLMREGRKRGDILAISIFVNPTQFGPGEDLDSYPRELEGDLEKARSVGVDCVFAPERGVIYPPGYQTRVEVREVARDLEGACRPDHFAGVATVVLKLFNIVQPDIALFGEKDYQQLLVVKRMVRDLDLEVEVVGRPTVREADGLALSSRNAYLSDEERRRALALSRALKHARELCAGGERDAARLAVAAREVVADQGSIELDYLEVRDAADLTPITVVPPEGARILVAARVGPARLIDNMPIP